ncbi:LOW QUALITY PROTEIN: G2/M phase-specific E3 ubiquitin-protein ligase-like, partial [Tympanuchus pallidicinctus]|uniref:LOW QUALITY PROTEIN: G2/M phase-specific E3 ubiquitin-protein ligase-like n=1 Tax=Tympanuchus pallidicinctus TaxID=109042 RepID=UPI0022873F36
MSSEKRKASSSEEPVCVLCGRADDDPDIFGRTIGGDFLTVHEFCLVFAHIAFEERPPEEESTGIDLAALTRKAKQANKEQCCVCGERGAAITCAESGCARSFHLPCAADGECITQHFGEHRSFCWEHRPRQTPVTTPAEDTICIICQETVRGSLDYHTMVCPMCTRAWFHRGCVQVGALPHPAGVLSAQQHQALLTLTLLVLLLQKQALNAGTTCFRCPSCRDD